MPRGPGSCNCHTHYVNGYCAITIASPCKHDGIPRHLIPSGAPCTSLAMRGSTWLTGSHAADVFPAYTHCYKSLFAAVQLIQGLVARYNLHTSRLGMRKNCKACKPLWLSFADSQALFQQQLSKWLPVQFLHQGAGYGEAGKASLPL